MSASENCCSCKGCGCQRGRPGVTASSWSATCNVDWGCSSVSPREVTAFPRVHYQTGVNSLLESVMEGLLPSSKPVSLDSLVRLLDDHLTKFAFLYRTILGVLRQPCDEAKKLLQARGRSPGKGIGPQCEARFSIRGIARGHIACIQRRSTDRFSPWPFAHGRRE